MEIPAGTTLGHYEILGPLGQGGMGQVYRARDTKLDREVALKLLPAEVSRDPGRLQRLEQEAKALARLNHPNIVTIYSVEEAGEHRFLSMELVEGNTLDATIGAAGLSVDALLDIGIPLASAIAAAHERGIIHRDLKPANVMITGDGTVKVLDFGLAKLGDPEPGDTAAPASDPDALTATSYPTSSPVTNAGTVMGTVSFMSPEQARGEPLDPRSDVFSLGILLYQAATGRLPFKGRTPADTLSSILRDTPAPINELNAELPNHLGRILRRCLEKDPEERLQSAAELARDLRDLQRELESGPTLESDAVGDASASPARRRAGLPAIVAVVAVVAIVGIGLWQLGLFSDSSGTEDEADAPPAAATVPDDDHDVIVIFPFENLGPAEDSYFAAGIAEEIRSRLAGIDSLSVISRTSAVQYDREGKTMVVIGRDLGIDYVLDGTVRWARSGDGTSRVRVTPQLTRVADDHQMWSTSFDDTLEEIFDVQSRIAEAVVLQLDLRLNATDAAAIETAPTDNFEAYQAYLRAIEVRFGAAYSPEQWLEAIALLERAVELDPEFTLAWASLSDAHSYFYHLRYDTTDERIRLARAAVDRALELEPASPRAHLALGLFHYRCHRDYERAMAEFSVAARDLPNDAEVLTGMAAVQRRLGHFDESARLSERVLRLDPRDMNLHWDLGITYASRGDFDRAEGKFEDAIALAPDALIGYTCMAFSSAMLGDIVEARKWLERAPEGWSAFHEIVWRLVLEGEGDYDALLARIEDAPWEVMEHATFHRPRSLVLAEIYQRIGDADRAELQYREALAFIDRELETRATDARIHIARGLALAGLGRREEAVAAAERAMELYPTSLDAFHGPHIEADAARICFAAGEYERGFDLVEAVLDGPLKIVLSVEYLQHSPEFDGVRDHARYQELLRKYDR